jgi:hypothetical protein
MSASEDGLSDVSTSFTSIAVAAPTPYSPTTVFQ